MIKFNKTITVTSALPYVNGVKHLGNIVGSILPADVFHRFLDLFGINNVYVCGTDDHGTAVEIAASEENLTPEAYAKKYYEIQKTIYEKWDFDFTFFGQTSSKTNHEITQDIFRNIYKNKYIKKQTITLPYCKKCRKYLADRYIEGTCPHCGHETARGDQCEKCGKVLDPAELKEPYCVVCKSKYIEFREEEHLFLDLTKLQPKLKEWIEKNTHWPENTRNFALGWIKEGLKPRCITRNLEWGVKVPIKGFEHLTVYVWVDAPIGYISITKDAQERKKIRDWKKFWSKETHVYHFLGKDNIPFHTIIWPGMLMAAEKYTLPYFVQGYEYLNWEGDKFSTSKGVGLFSDEALDLFPADYWRFYLSSLLPENKDSNFDWDGFQKKINSELIGNFGNLFHRATHFIVKNFGSRVPHPKLRKKEHELEKTAKNTIKRIEQLIEEVKLRDALKEIMALASETNKYFQEKQPWETIKTDKQDCETTLYTTVNVLRIISTLLYPYIPGSSEKALRLLGVKVCAWENLHKFTIKPGHEVKAQILFRKIEADELEKAKKYITKHKKKQISEKGIEETEKSTSKPANLNFKIGTIISVEDHPDAEKLYVLQVDLGGEARQLVAGLKKMYKKEELEGRQIAVVTNLEPKELRGVRSHGMLLAAEPGVILSPREKVENGANVHGFNSEKTISFPEFQKINLHVEDTNSGQIVLCNGEKLRVMNILISPEKNVRNGAKVL